MISSYDVYVMFGAIREHFVNTRYDYFKERGRIYRPRNGMTSTIENCCEILLDKYKTKEELLRFFMVSMKDEDFPSAWIGHYNNKAFDDEYQVWQGFMSRFGYEFEKDLKLIGSHLEMYNLKLKDIYEWDCFSSPVILDFVWHKHDFEKISVETFLVLNDIFNFFWKFEHFSGWNEKLENRYLKYVPFIVYDKAKFYGMVENILVDKL